MEFSDFICLEAIRTELKARDSEGVVREMTRALMDAGQLAGDLFESIVREVFKREEMGSTAMGRGVAIPHAKHPSVQQTVGTVALSRQGVDFASLDGELSHVFFLVISPLDCPDEQLRALERIARSVQTGAFCRFLRQAKSAADIERLLKESDDLQV